MVELLCNTALGNQWMWYLINYKWRTSKERWYLHPPKPLLWPYNRSITDSSSRVKALQTWIQIEDLILMHSSQTWTYHWAWRATIKGSKLGLECKQDTADKVVMTMLVITPLARGIKIHNTSIIMPMVFNNQASNRLASNQMEWGSSKISLETSHLSKTKWFPLIILQIKNRSSLYRCKIKWWIKELSRIRVVISKASKTHK